VLAYRDRRDKPGDDISTLPENGLPGRGIMQRPVFTSKACARTDAVPFGRSVL
jgi:hypothetical protein